MTAFLDYEHYYDLYMERVGEIRPYLSDFWWEVLPEYHEIFRREVPRNFQQIPFRGGFVVNGQDSMESQRREFQCWTTDDRRQLLAQGVWFSGSKPTTVHHMWQFDHFLRKHSEPMETVIEWGGGYGDMARIVRHRYQNTYIIVDIPFMSLLQCRWLYEMDMPVWCVDDEREIREGYINLVPLTNLHALDGHFCDLFISNYALSESSQYAQEYVEDRKNFFGSKHLLLSYEDNQPLVPDSTTFAHRVRRLPNAEIFPISPMYATGEILVR